MSADLARYAPVIACTRYGEDRACPYYPETWASSPAALSHQAAESSERGTFGLLTMRRNTAFRVPGV